MLCYIQISFRVLYLHETIRCFLYLLDYRTRNLISWKNSDVKLKRWLLTRQYIITLYHVDNEKRRPVNTLSSQRV